MILADASEDYQGIAIPSIILENTEYEIVAGLHTIAIRPKEANSLYLYYLFNSNTFRKYGYRIGTGMKVFGISAKNVLNFEYSFPCHDEQAKIGKILLSIDKLITLQQHKLEALQQLKQALLQKLFPSGKEKVPQLRFAHFHEKWEQRKLGDVIDNQYNGQTPSRMNPNFWNGDINWLSSGELNRGVVLDTIEKITPDGKNSTNLKVVPKGTFVMAITGLEAAGTRGNCAKLGIDTTLNQSCMALFPNEKLLNSSFLFQWYRKVGEEYGLKYTQGTKQQSYNAELIKILPMILPSVEEQILIANFFDKLDKTIALQKKKITQLEAIKRAFLQKMFV